MMRVCTAEAIRVGLELVIRRSEADVLRLQLSGAPAAVLREARDDLKTAVENLAEFFVLTSDQGGSPILAQRLEGTQPSLH